MGSPDASIALSSCQVTELNRKLSVMRHNVNTHLALIVAASELLRRKPEMAERLIENILQQPDRSIKEIRAFSDEFDAATGLKRESPFAGSGITCTGT